MSEIICYLILCAAPYIGNERPFAIIDREISPGA